jgi:glucose-6-phosphate 1-epimerase
MIEELNKRFAINSNIEFLVDPTIGEVLKVSSKNSLCEISLFGGQVLSWRPINQAHEVLWRPRSDKYLRATAIRGGVPICWPWFGAHPTNENLPGHGYARITNWVLTSIVSYADGAVEVFLTLGRSDLASKHWSSRVSLDLKISVGTTLEIELTTHNEDVNEIEFTEGLHTYFQISDIANIQVVGLSGAEYIDLVNKNERCTQDGPISFDGELGRIFLENKAVCIIEDKVFKRFISIEKIGSHSTAIWNPGIQVASKMPDLGPIDWRGMVCVESANTLSDKISLAGNQYHKHKVIYSVY